MHFMVFSCGQDTEWGYFWKLLKILIFFFGGGGEVLEIPDIFWG